MPKEAEMSQISRPFQIALAAVFLLLAVWLIALRGHSSGASSSPAVATSAQATTPSATAPSSGGAPAAHSAPGGGTAASAGGEYRGSAPGVAGLTRAIDKAQGAVKLSERNAQQLQRKSAQASSASASPGAGASSSSAARAQTTGTAKAGAPATSHSSSKPAAKPPARKGSHAGTQAKQALVEGELAHGQTVIVLFWSARGAVDVAVRAQLRRLHRGRKLVVHLASGGEVGRYGTITRSLQVDQTPTMLVIAPSGKTKTLTGLVDAYAIEQAIAEARSS
jgi:hypothetical protein